MAEELAGLGATVQYACSSDQAPIDERNQEWESKGVKVTGSVFDLKSTTQRENLMNTFSSAFDGKLNILLSLNSLPLQKQAKLAWKWAKDNIRTNTVKLMYNNNNGAKVRADDGLCRPAEPNEISSLECGTRVGLVIALPHPFAIAKGKGNVRDVTIHMNSNSPCKRLMVFSLIAMATTIHMRYDERNLYRVLVWEVKNMTKIEHGLFLHVGWPGFVGHTTCLSKFGPLEGVAWAWALSYPGLGQSVE
ncbi:unnamed protein product [Prunus armeniaca]